MKRDIFVALSTFGKFGACPLNLLKSSGHEFFINPTGKRLNKEETVEYARNSDGIIAGLEIYDGEVLDKLPKLRCISRCGVGIDNIDKSKAKEKGITILNTPGVVIQPVAELTVAMIFDLIRKLTLHAILMKNKKWERKDAGLLKGKKVGILGLGRIGKRVTEIMKALETEVYGADVNPDYSWAQKHGIKLVETAELIRCSDILSIHLSDEIGIPFCLGKEEFAMMKDNVIVVNVSRGKFVDEDALYEALVGGKVQAAGLDVFNQEPYNGKLCELDNVVLTPHLATLTNDSRLEMETEATANLINFFKA